MIDVRIDVMKELFVLLVLYDCESCVLEVRRINEVEVFDKVSDNE